MTDQNESLLDRLHRENEAGELSRTSRTIADFIQKRPNDFLDMTTRQISDALSVSEPSLVRFCRSFGYKGISDFRIALAKASAVKNLFSDAEPDHNQKLLVNLGAKLKIARYALSLAENDRSILLDSGSTVRCFAKALVDHSGLTIMTTGIHNLLELKDASQHQLMLAGGIFRREAMALSGRQTERALQDMSFDTAYIGADSLSTQVGLSTYDEEEAHLTRTMVRSARRTVVLADSHKFIAPALHVICGLEKIDTIVTDIPPAEEIGKALAALGVRLIVAKGDTASDPSDLKEGKNV